jgi:hypothetical protein
VKPPPQLVPPSYEPADIEAFQALQRGDASEHQQRRALDWLVNKAASTYDLSFSPGDQHLTAFAEGRRYVGLQVVKLLALNPNVFAKD